MNLIGETYHLCGETHHFCEMKTTHLFVILNY